VPGREKTCSASLLWNFRMGRNLEMILSWFFIFVWEEEAQKD
jgi:hypothetical protein